MIPKLQRAEWVHTGKKAKLMVEDEPMIELEMNKKGATFKWEKKKYRIFKEGFWCPRILVTENDNVVGTQKQLGLWGTRTEVVMDKQTYLAKTRQGSLLNITYSLRDAEVLAYKLGTEKRKPKITLK